MGSSLSSRQGDDSLKDAVYLKRQEN
jgi:hypothetical protein